MRAKIYEMCHIGTDLFIYCPEISSDIDTTVSCPDIAECMVSKKRMKWIFVEEAYAFFDFAFFSSPEFFKPLPKLLMKNSSHDFSLSHAIASFALSNAGEIFLPFM